MFIVPQGAHAAGLPLEEDASEISHIGHSGGWAPEAVSRARLRIRQHPHAQPLQRSFATLYCTVLYFTVQDHGSTMNLRYVYHTVVASLIE